MRCLGCPPDTEPGKASQIFRKLLLCVPCHAMATKADAELNRASAEALERSKQWLEQHIMSGGLHSGGSGLEPVLPPFPVTEPEV